MKDIYNADKITCPYCDHVFDNSLEYLHDEFDRDGAEDIISCENCCSDFKVMLNVEYSYDSHTIEDVENKEGG